MAQLKWGKPKIEIIKLVDGAVPTQSPVWIELKNPKEGTTTLNVTDGNKQEAIVEGGDVLAVRKGANKYSLETTLYAVGAKPVADVDGIIDGEYAVRVTPENTTLKGYIMDKTSASIQETYTPTDGGLWKYVFEGLKPATGAVVKEFTPA